MFARQPVAYSPRYYEALLLGASRFLGVPNGIWSGSATLMIGLTGWFASGQELGPFLVRYGLWLLLVAALIWWVFRCLTPGRDAVKRAALEEHRREVRHVASLHGVDTDAVLLANSETERQRLEMGRAEPDPENRCALE